MYKPCSQAMFTPLLPNNG